MPYLINIRDRRQITLPKDILEQLSLSIGDNLVVEVERKKLIAKPVKNQTLDTLKTIQKAFQKAKINEQELQKNGLVLRKKLVKQAYGS